MDQIAQWIEGGAHIDPALLLLGLMAAIFVALLVLIAALLRQGTARARMESLQAEQARAAEAEMAELKGRIAALAEHSASRQSELARQLHERLDRVGELLGSNLAESQRRTSEHLSQLHERLAVIDSAQKNLTELSSRVVSLQDILANKQARGAFGQMRMEAIIQDGLPREAYRFQPTLSNGKRPDCLLLMPGSAGGIAVDAKFPLEGFEALRLAHDEVARKEAQRRIRSDIGRHIEDIAGKYLIPGETQDTALMFVPAESVYAELHEAFPDLIQKAHRARVMIVSPNMLMLAVQTMFSILKDVRMREQAGIIQREVGHLMQDVRRLRDRVADFQKHFSQLGPDLERILTSSDRIAERGRRIEGLDFEERRNGAAGPLIPAGE